MITIIIPAWVVCIVIIFSLLSIGLSAIEIAQRRNRHKRMAEREDRLDQDVANLPSRKHRMSDLWRGEQ